jgi:hypothetical protein
MNTSMTFYLKEVIRPYSESIRAEIGDPEVPILLMMDSQSGHNQSEHIQRIKKLNVCQV